VTVITAIPFRSSAHIALTIQPSSPVRRIVRTDVNGPAMLRVPARMLPSSGLLTVEDREAALVGPVRYDVDDGARGATATTELAASMPWLSLPLLAAQSVQVDSVTGYDAARDSLSTLHYPINRVDPLVTLGKMRTRAGRLEVYCSDHTAASRLYRLAGKGEIMLLRQAEHRGLDMYFTVTRDGVEYVDGSWLYSADYTEVAWPGGDLVTREGWTFADLKTSADTFETVTSRYLTFDQLKVDERI